MWVVLSRIIYKSIFQIHTIYYFDFTISSWDIYIFFCFFDMKRPVMLILIFDIVIVWNKLKFVGPQVIYLLSRKQAKSKTWCEEWNMKVRERSRTKEISNSVRVRFRFVILLEKWIITTGVSRPTQVGYGF